MKTNEMNNTIINGYIALLDNLSANNKLDLISKLSASIKTDLSNKKSKFKSAFGAFESAKSADEIIKEIKSSRLFNREIDQNCASIDLIYSTNNEYVFLDRKLL